MARTDRNYIFYEYTQSICPACLTVIPAKIIIQDAAVYLLKNGVTQTRADKGTVGVYLR